MTLGGEIRKARMRLEWTQTQLAERLGVTPSFITKLEKDESLPSRELTITLANLLVLDSERLLALLENSKEKRHKLRRNTRTAAAHQAYGLPRPGEAEGAAPRPGPAEQLGREILDDPDLHKAFFWLRAALADPALRPFVLKTLEAWARDASRPEDERPRGR